MSILTPEKLRELRESRPREDVVPVPNPKRLTISDLPEEEQKRYKEMEEKRREQEDVIIAEFRQKCSGWSKIKGCECDLHIRKCGTCANRSAFRKGKLLCTEGYFKIKPIVKW